MENQKVSVIIINYNTASILKECLENLLRSSPSLELIVVDNASSDGSVEMVKRVFPSVILIESKENKGLAAGYNLGLSKTTGDLVLLLGSDAFPEKETITGLTSFFAEHPEVGIATCKLILRNGKLDMDAHRGFPTPWTAFTHFSHLDKIFKGSPLFDRYFLGLEDLNQPHEIDLCISHFMMVRRAVFESVGKFDESFFVYGEDVDFCYRVKKKGWKIMYLPQWQATHYKGASVGIRKETEDISTASTETKRRMSQESADAMLIFYKKHYLNSYPKVFTFIIFLAIGLKKKYRQWRFR